MSAVDLTAVMSGLRSFQQDAVKHVVHQFYGPEADSRSGRFLIADETGLGKSVVARGVIAHTIRQLENDNSVDQINIVYICSNRDLAQQNLKRLNVTGNREIAMATRLSLLALESGRLNSEKNVGSAGQKPVNLVSFTPGTSFSTSAWRQGNAAERALVVLLLDAILDQNSAQQHATRVMFRGTVKTVERFSGWHVDEMHKQLKGHLDADILRKFTELATEDGALADFIELRDGVSNDVIPRETWNAIQEIIARLRSLLAKASVETLKPDLVILDEFQRFKGLLDVESGGEAAELADQIFSYGNAKVLLLSATPYKPFTQADTDEEDHYEDFLATIKFLCSNNNTHVSEVEGSLREYRRALVSNADASAAAEQVRTQLTSLMTRSERPNTIAERDLVHVRQLRVHAPDPAALESWRALSDLGALVGSQANIEYWKSVPHFTNFMDHYRIADKTDAQLREAPGGPASQALRRVGGITARQVAKRARIDTSHGPLQALMSETLDQGWWKLLWMPPSMPYVAPGPIFAPFSDGSVTKHVIFSAWSAAPTSIAAILSHEATRRMGGYSAKGHPSGEATDLTARLTYGPSVGHSTLAMFWPHPGLLHQTDQLQQARAHGGAVPADDFISNFNDSLGSGAAAAQAWEAFFSLPNSFDPEFVDQRFAVDGAAEDEADGSEETHPGTSQLRGTLASMQEYVDAHGTEPLRHPDLAWLATFAPGSVAYRSVRTIAGTDCTHLGLWRAAFMIAEALRALFNRSDSMELLDTLYKKRSDLSAYWQRVLAYCADGNLRSVLDEYLFQLWCETGQANLDDRALMDIARRVAQAISLRPARYLARESRQDRREIPMMTRFAVRYGDAVEAKGESESGVARQAAVRAGFNSPFAPFVLASTSVGQEGIDFHWWSHSVVHWNLPSNPVDFEQREGRVNRYGGHAVRKNVAAAHWDDVLKSSDRCAWNAAFNAASQVPSEAGEFSPWWVYPGQAQVQRVLAPYPLSRDIEKYDQLREALTLYRLTLGQPRQEDMVEMLQRRGVNGAQAPTIDLSPLKSSP